MNKARLQIAFMTGRSSPQCWHLSPRHSAFINQLAAPDRQLVDLNFPYQLEGNGHYLAPGLLKASYHNFLEFMAARRPSFALCYRGAFIDLLEQAHHTVLLSGSCGLELFNNLDLPDTLLSTISIFAYGPVAYQRPLCHHLLVQGRRDSISRCWFRDVDIQVGGGHMNYLANPDVLTHCRRFISSIESERSREA